MPYVRQRSILQRAPRFSMRQRGLGDTAQCPSLEQLQGIADSNDPCQNPIASLPVSTLTLPPNLTASGILTSDIAPYLPGTPGYAALNTPMAQFTQFLNAYKTPLMIGGGLLGALLLVKAMR